MRTCSSQARIKRRIVARAQRAQPLCIDRLFGNVSMFNVGGEFCHVRWLLYASHRASSLS